MLKYALALAVALVLNASANLMMKMGVRAIDLELGGAGLMSAGAFGAIRLLLKHWILLLGLGCFAANVFFYTFALQRMPISVAYPLMVTGGFAIIVIAAGWWLDERLSLAQWVGIGAILLGVVLVAKDAGRQMGAAPAGGQAASPEPERP